MESIDYMPIQRLEVLESEDKISKPTPCKTNRSPQPSSLGSEDFKTAMSTSPPLQTGFNGDMPSYIEHNLEE